MNVNIITNIFLKFQKIFAGISHLTQNNKKVDTYRAASAIFVLQEMLRVAQSESGSLDKIRIYYV